MQSLRLWILFIAYSAKAIARLRWPTTITRTEVLGRELFSGHLNKSGTVVRPNAFLVGHASKFGISLDRLSLAPLQLFVALAEKAATRRNVGFKGLARLMPEDLAKVQIDGKSVLFAKGEPTCANPCHANVPLPRDQDRDYYLLIATELVKYAKPPRQ